MSDTSAMIISLHGTLKPHEKKIIADIALIINYITTAGAKYTV